MRYCVFIISLALLFFSCSHEKQTAHYEIIKAGFSNPPVEARPKAYWWWLNGHVDTVRLREELQAMKKAGLGGVDIFEIGVPASENQQNEIPAGPAFMGDDFLKSLNVVLKEAKALNMEVGINLASSWNAGGSWTQPAHASKTIYVSKVNVRAGEEQHKISFPTIPPLDPRRRPRVVQYESDGKPLYRKEIAVLAVPKNKSGLDTSKIINVSDYFNTETDQLNWKAPAGTWEIHRYVCANSGEQLFMPSANSVGPIIDHYDSAATRAHLNYFIDRLKPLVGDFTTSPIKYFYLASYEAKDFAWTESLPEAFRLTAGYGVEKFLPALFDTTLFTKQTNTQFQFDLRMTLSELMINNHYRKAKEVSNKAGLKIASESGGPGVYTIPVEVLKALGSLDIPRGEFWHRTTRFDKDSVDIIFLVKEIAAASHIYKRGVVEEEAFTSFINDWQEGPHDLKVVADRAFCEGMNRVVIHGFTHNTKREGLPGIGYFAGTHFNDKSGWWNKGKPFIDYLSRISYVLQQTNFVADVLYYYGDDVPNLVPPKNTRYQVGAGYDYEIVNKEILLRDLVLKEGKLCLPGVGTYHVLDIGSPRTMSQEIFNKLKQLTEAGAVIVGKKPETLTGLTVEAEQLWNTTNVLEKGKISEQSALVALQALAVQPDFVANKQLDFIHYQKDELDFYLVRNTTKQPLSLPVKFRQLNKQPELWDSVTGEISIIPYSNQNATHISVPLSIAAQGTALVCFRSTSTKAKQGPLPSGPAWVVDDKAYQVSSQQQVSSPWTITFPKQWGAPDSLVMTTLESFTRNANSGVKYFSGNANYFTAFETTTASSTERMVLNLGTLNHVAEVWLNDQPLGIVWTSPYQVDITKALKSGTNKLRIEVANNWSNRLTGDAILGEAYVSTNIKIVNRGKKLGWDSVALIESGLLGPVTIQTWRKINE